VSLTTLPPTLRTPKRYVFFDITGVEGIAFERVVDRVWQRIMDVHGEQGVAKIDCWVMKNLYDDETATGVIRVHKDYVNELRGALCLAEPIDGGIITVLGTSGTIKAGAKQFLERNISMLS